MNQVSLDWTNATLTRRYRVLAQLGEGGMGYVYRARDLKLGTDVVIKVPRLAILENPRFANRFRREIRSLLRLSHANIVTILDVGEHEGILFAVMSYLRGGDLEARRERDAAGAVLPMAVSSLATWLPAVAKALDYVHRKGYVHRDIKPANILFDDDGNPCVSDFGIAKVLAESGEAGTAAVTGADLVLGTPEYMAPELVMGEKFDGRADQYALAMTAYELLAGRLPFDGATPAAILVKQTTQTAPPLHTVVAVSPALSRSITKALSKAPSARFVNCSDFAQAAMAAVGTKSAVGDGIGDTGTFRELPADTKLACPDCQRVLKVTAEHAGRNMDCSNCRATLWVAEDLSGLSAQRRDGNTVALSSAVTGATARAVSPPKRTPVAIPRVANVVRLVRYNWMAAVTFVVVVGVLAALMWPPPSSEPVDRRTSADNSLSNVNSVPSLQKPDSRKTVEEGGEPTDPDAFPSSGTRGPTDGEKHITPNDADSGDSVDPALKPEYSSDSELLDSVDPAVDAGNPFRQLPKEVELDLSAGVVKDLQLRLGSLAASGNTAWNITLDSAAVNLEGLEFLVGQPDDVGKEVRWPIYMTYPEGDGQKPSELHDDAVDSTVPLAHLVSREKTLFVELEADARVRQVVQLRNCMLSLSDGIHSHTMQLRQPQRMPALVLDLANPNETLEISLATPPSNSSMVLHFNFDGGVPDGFVADPPGLQIGVSEDFTLRAENWAEAAFKFRLTESKGQLRLKITALYELNGRRYPLTIDAVNKELNRMERQLVENRADLDAAERQLARVSDEIGNVRSRTAMSLQERMQMSSALDRLAREGKKYESRIRRLSEATPKLERSVEQVRALLPIIRNLNRQLIVPMRLYAKTSGGRIGLLNAVD